MTELTVYHSIIDADSLQRYLSTRYVWPAIQRCRLIRLGLNDTYEVQCLNQKFIVRLYRAAWRSVSEVQAEIELLLWLQARSFPVSAAIPAIDGQCVQRFHVAEGERCLVAFDYINGQALSLDTTQTLNYGRLLAELHQTTDDFSFHSQRFALDNTHLIDEPLRHLERAYGHHVDDIKFIKTRAVAAAKTLQALPKTAPLYGICHGDHFGNVLRQADHSLVMIDFDCYGMGYRLYDVVQFYWAIHLRMGAWRELFLDDNMALWQAFLQGYQSVRPLHDSEWQAMPAMLFIRSLWGLALQPQNEQHWGTEEQERIWQQNLPLFHIDVPMPA